MDKGGLIQENANPSQLTYADKMMYADVCSA